MDDWECLSQYVQEGSETAFREVVCRHVDLVYATCRRVVRDAHLAEDATQAVFVILAKKARKIRRNTSLVGWLHNTARYVACNAMRVAANRRRHEMEAAQMPRNRRDAAASNDVAEDVVDRALNRLEAQERDAILLRFFEGRSFREVGAVLSISEEAAKKRVWRGIEKLRQMLTPTGSAAPAAATIAGILTAAHQAPATLAAAAASTALAGTGVAFSLAKGAVIAMAISKTKATAAAIVLALILMGGAAVVVNQIVNRPRAVTSSISTTRPATQPAAALDGTTGDAIWLADTVPVLETDKIIGEPTVLVAPPCSHLQKNPKIKVTTCTSCHKDVANGTAAVKLGGATLALNNGLIVLGTQMKLPLTVNNAAFVAGDQFVIEFADTNGLAAGTEAPAFDVKQVDGTKLALADLKGKFVLLHFWDSKSKESLEQMPHLRAAAREWANEPKLIIVGINLDEKQDAAAAFEKEQKMDWVEGYAGAGSNLLQQYHVGVGAAVLIGPDGKIVAGSLQGLAIDDALDKALRAQPVNAPARP